MSFLGLPALSTRWGTVRRCCDCHSRMQELAGHGEDGDMAGGAWQPGGSGRRSYSRSVAVPREQGRQQTEAHSPRTLPPN